MSVSNTLTYAQSPPIRPSLADMQDGVKINATPTVPPNMPSAQEFNQVAQQCAAIGGLAPVAILSITFSAGTPSVNSFRTLRGDMLIGDFTVTDNSTGNTSITVASGKFPAAICSPMVSLNSGAGNNRAPDVVAIANGVQVRTTDGGGSAADLNFTVAWY